MGKPISANDHASIIRGWRYLNRICEEHPTLCAIDYDRNRFVVLDQGGEVLFEDKDVFVTIGMLKKHLEAK